MTQDTTLTKSLIQQNNPATRNLQPTTCNLQPKPATCNLQPATCTCDLQPATCTCNLQPATCNLQPAPATYNLQPTTCNLQPTTCICTCNLQFTPSVNGRPTRIEMPKETDSPLYYDVIYADLEALVEKCKAVNV